MNDNVLPFEDPKRQLKKALKNAEAECAKLFSELDGPLHEKLTIMKKIAAETDVRTIELLVAKLRLVEAGYDELMLRNMQAHSEKEKLKKALEEKQKVKEFEGSKKEEK